MSTGARAMGAKLVTARKTREKSALLFSCIEQKSSAEMSHESLISNYRSSSIDFRNSGSVINTGSAMPSKMCKASSRGLEVSMAL